MHVIRCAIERINIPTVLCIGRSFRTPFLADESVLRKTRLQNASNDFLRGQIRFGHQVGGPFFTGSKSANPI